MAMNRRDFIRQGSLWVAGALVAEPVVKRLWAFPTNPVARGVISEGGYRARPFSGSMVYDTSGQVLRIFYEGKWLPLVFQ